MGSSVIVNAFEAWDSFAQKWVKLRAGMIVRDFRVGFDKGLGQDGSIHPYTAEFEADGSHYSCPLHTFQARTEILVEAPAPVNALI